jgi:toxin ParE1/3/4
VTVDIQISAAAEQDIKDIWRGLVEYRIDFADQKVRQIEQKFLLLAQFPLAGRSREDILPGLRSIPIDHLILLYQILEQNDRTIVEIVRVTDLNRLFNPDDSEEPS